jgi:hypothetical protein
MLTELGWTGIAIHCRVGEFEVEVDYGRV